VTFTYGCLIVSQQHRQYIPCFIDESKLNYPKQSSLNAEQQALYLQLMMKYAKKHPFPTPVDEKELKQYEVCVFVYVHVHGAGLHKSWCQVTLVATFFMLGTQFGMCFR
jgi:hypothetical protein